MSTGMSTTNDTVLVYDTTLRDGAQGEGVNFSLEDKQRLAKALDDIGVHYIEGGWPGSNPKDIEFFRVMRQNKLQRAKLVAFGSTRRAANPAEKDPVLKQLLEAETDAIAIVGKSWDMQVTEALRVGLDVNLDMIASSVAFLKKHASEVFFDAEHFFDGYKANPNYALATLAEALEAGADAVVLCDTNGGSLVHEITAVVDAVRERFPAARVGIHCHNDGGMATANTVEAVMRGAGMFQACLNGFGERTGNADLCSVLPVLELKCGKHCIGPENLKKITSLSRYGYELASLPRRDHQPFVGASAFAHKAGMHVSGLARDSRTYEAFDPKAVGNKRRILISELAGRTSIIARYPELQENVDQQKAILADVMELEKEGYAFENADASFALLVMKRLGKYDPAFELVGFRASTEERDVRGLLNGEVTGHDARVRISEASVKLMVDDIELHTVAEELNGPVAALDLALRKALLHFFPFADDLRLTDFRVHIVNAQAGVEARVRTVIQSQVGEETWGTVGVSENILSASCQALVDSFQYLIALRGGRKAAHTRVRLHQI